MGLLGGSLPIPGASSLPPFLEGGSFTITGSGGKDVGPFTANINMASLVTWTNGPQLDVINRSSGATGNWSGGDASQKRREIRWTRSPAIRSPS